MGKGLAEQSEVDDAMHGEHQDQHDVAIAPAAIPAAASMATDYHRTTGPTAIAPSSSMNRSIELHVSLAILY